jgi:hypothetical protein
VNDENKDQKQESKTPNKINHTMNNKKESQNRVFIQLYGYTYGTIHKCSHLSTWSIESKTVSQWPCDVSCCCETISQFPLSIMMKGC